MRKNLEAKHIILGISALFLLIGFGVPGELEASRGDARDARIITSMGQYRSQAEISNANDRDYSGVGTGIDYVSLEERILNQGGTGVTVATSTDGSAYCAYTRLALDESAYYCVDSINFASIRTYIDPGQAGYCSEATFVCPTEVGNAPLEVRLERQLPNIIGWSGLLLVIVGLIFTWKRAFKQRKEELARVENWAMVRQEIKSRRAFYVLVIVFFISVILAFVAFANELFQSLPLPVNITLLLFVYLFPLFVPLLIFLVSFTAIKRAWRNATEPVCWESYASFLTFTIIWFILIYSLLWGILSGMVLSISSSLYILGLGLSMSCFIHRGMLNKIYGLSTVSIFILFGILAAFIYMGTF